MDEKQQGAAPQQPQQPPTLQAAPGGVSKEDCTMGMLCHLLGIFTLFLGALIIWLIKKDQSTFLDDQGKEALNFQLTILIAWVAAGVLSFVLIGCFLMPVIWVLNIIFCIMGALAANKGQRYRYPFNIRFIK